MPGRWFLSLIFWSSLPLTLSFGATPEDQCLRCHEVVSPGTVKELKASAHASLDFACAGCHGGNPAETVERVAHQGKFRARISRAAIPALCDSCHGDVSRMKFYGLDTNVLREYQTSQHGIALRSGDVRVAVCTDCHGTHEILSKRDPRSPVHKTRVPQTCGRCHSRKELMQSYGLPANQVDEYERGIHGQVLRGKYSNVDPILAPTCADCHGVHGATPPEFEEIVAVCSTCHPAEARYFREGPHQAALRQVGSPRCIDCHGSHENSVPSTGLVESGQGACARCHPPESAAAQSSRHLGTLLERARKELERTGDAIRPLSGAPQEGELRLRLKEVNEEFRRVGALNHTLDQSELERAVAELGTHANLVVSLAAAGRGSQGGARWIYFLSGAAAAAAAGTVFWTYRRRRKRGS
ncbi:MAG: cytochrome c3 family protein [Acidobacteria bacterium]|nr:cytochrome c3 family protein [Acidobacteriota bacterium]